MTAERRTDARYGEAEAVIPFRLRRDIAITETPDPEVGSTKFYVKVLASGEVFEFGEEELFICQSLDGDITPSELRGAFQVRFGMQLSDRKLLEFIAELRAMNLLVPIGDGSTSRASRPSWGAAMFEDVGARDQRPRYEDEDRLPRQPDREHSASPEVEGRVPVSSVQCRGHRPRAGLAVRVRFAT